MLKRLLWFLVLASLACTSGETTWSPQRRSSKAPFRHIVLVVIDTLRADTVQEVHTPVLDRIAASGASVRRAWSSGTWTVPSIVSLFSGSTVRGHGWDLPAARIGHYPSLPPDQLLAERLRDAGFDTTGLYANPYLSEALGFDRGFNRWIRTTDQQMAKKLAGVVHTQIDQERRQFFYLHLIGPHSPLNPTKAAQARTGLASSWFDGGQGLQIGAAKRNQKPGIRQAYRAAYGAVVEDTDVRLGQTLDALGPLLNDALVVVTSDHGELLGEHGIVGHGRHVYEPLTHVPLIVGDITTLPSTMNIDAIADLITRLAGVSSRWKTEARLGRPLVSQREGQVALSTDGVVKGVWTADGTRAFHLENDPGEDHPILIPPALSAAHTKWIKTTTQAITVPLHQTLPSAAQSELRALGYAE